MDVYTVQMGQHRQVTARGLSLTDITLKSGNRAFAPDPKLLAEYKRGEITEAEYTGRFYALMRVSYRIQPKAWDALLANETLVLACYCKAGCFCHRYLMVDILRKICERGQRPFDYRGEITKDGIVNLDEHIAHLSPG